MLQTRWHWYIILL